METLNRSSSTDFLLLYSQHSPFRSLDIKTYGSHYLQIGSKGRRRHWKKGGRDRTLQIASLQYTRWGGTALIMRWADVIPMETSIMGRMSHFVHLSLRGWEEEWSTSLLNYWKEFLTKNQLETTNTNIHMMANVNSGQHIHKNTHTHALTRGLQMKGTCMPELWPGLRCGPMTFTGVTGGVLLFLLAINFEQTH